MIHIDVHYDRTHPSDAVVETSIDGGPWKVHYTFPHTSGDSPDVTIREAENTARIMVHAIEFATGERPRATSRGYSL